MCLMRVLCVQRKLAHTFLDMCNNSTRIFNMLDLICGNKVCMRNQTILLSFCAATVTNETTKRTLFNNH